MGAAIIGGDATLLGPPGGPEPLPAPPKSPARIEGAGARGVVLAGPEGSPPELPEGVVPAGLRGSRPERLEGSVEPGPNSPGVAANKGVVPEASGLSESFPSTSFSASSLSAMRFLSASEMGETASARREKPFLTQLYNDTTTTLAMRNQPTEVLHD